MKGIKLPKLPQFGPRWRKLFNRVFNLKRLLITLIVALVLSVAAWTVALYLASRPEKVVLSTEESIPGQIVSLENDKIEQLATERVNAASDYTGAHAKAAALAQQGKYADAAVVYKEMIDTGKASHEVYVEYATALYYGDDEQGGIAAMKAAIEKVKNSAELTQADKDALVKDYSNLLSAYEEEGGQS